MFPKAHARVAKPGQRRKIEGLVLSGPRVQIPTLAPTIRIKDEDLIRFLKYLREERNNSQKTVMNVFNSLSSFYEFLVYNKKVRRNPIPPIRKRYVRSYKNHAEEAEKQLLTVEEISTKSRW